MSRDNDGRLLVTALRQVEWKGTTVWIRRVASAAIVIALAVIVYEERRTLASALLDSDPWILILIATATLVSWVVNTYSQDVIFRALDKDLPFSLLIGLHVGGGLLNYLPMRPGTFYRAHSMKQRAGLRYARFGSFLFTNTVLYFAVTAVLGTITIVFYYGLRTQEALVLTVLLGVCALTTLVLVLCPLPGNTGSSRISRMLNDLIAGRDLVVQDRRVLTILVLLHVLLFLVTALRMSGAFLAVGTEIPLAGSMVLGAVSMLALIVSLTPSGIGIQEFVVAAAGTLLGIPFLEGFAAAAVLRAVALTLYVSIGLPSLVWLRLTRLPS